MQKKPYKPNPKRTIITLLLIAFFVFAFSMHSIYKSVKQACIEAVEVFKGDCVDSLIQITQSDNFDYVQKNHAIWALGQLADERALTVLQELNESAVENECKLNEAICKYEVEKAIKWCKKGNITNWMYTKLKN